MPQKMARSKSLLNMTNMKECSNCKRLLSSKMFSLDNYRKDKLQSTCKKCKSILHKKIAGTPSYKEHARKLMKEWRAKNREHSREYQRIYYGKYRITHRIAIRKQQRKYSKYMRKHNIQFKLTTLLRTRLYTALKKSKKIYSAIKDMGCSPTELKVFLERKFKPGMTWENHGRNGWHIDHIKPLCQFDLTDKKQYLKAIHYSNLQPLWAYENLTKRKII